MGESPLRRKDSVKHLLKKSENTLSTHKVRVEENTSEKAGESQIRMCVDVKELEKVELTNKFRVLTT